MHCPGVIHVFLLTLLLSGNWSYSNAAETFRVATFNLENYVLSDRGSRPAKSEAGKAKIRESIMALKADVLAVQEIGGEAALKELKDALAKDGQVFPAWELVKGYDSNIQVAVLSRFPIIASRSHTRESFLLQGRRFRVSRGFAEVDIRVNESYTFTLFVAHLKSKRASAQADEAELRLEEAKLLREKIEARLAANPQGNLLVAGDLNDYKNTPPIREIIGTRGRNRLVDTRPAERSGQNPTTDPRDARPITWTYFYSTEDLYSRIDYLLLNAGMAREWVQDQTYVLALPGWGEASDHRPLVATFISEDK